MNKKIFFLIIGGLVCIVLATAAFALASGGISSLGQMFAANDGTTTADVPGNASAFDPIANYAAVKAFAGDKSHLISLDAWYVKSDGTLELTADYTPSPYAEYEFYQEIPTPSDAPPVGAGGNNGGSQWYQDVTVKLDKPGQSYHVTTMSGNYSSDYFYTSKGMEREVSSSHENNSSRIIADPKCSFKDLWQTAIKNGADSKAVARIEYSNGKYEFSINDKTNTDLTFGADCKLQSDF